MDSIDFNSYLETEIDGLIIESQEYNDYLRNFSKASEILDRIQDKIGKKKFNSKKELPLLLIYELFEAKRLRLEARKQSTRKGEINKYLEEIHNLHKNFSYIAKDYFYDNQKDKTRDENYNWAKLLFYNEFAICYSGVAESSISLGYAERSIALLKELSPKVDPLKEEFPQNNSLLYTFALYNKGEAERLLGNISLSLKAFKKIIDRYKKVKGDKPSDYYSASLKMALILLDQGRGDEALEYLKNVQISDFSDYRIHTCNLEKISAYIDQKEYKKARTILELYDNPMDKNFTFVSRNSALHKIRCLIEWRKNKPRDFLKSKKWRLEYESIPNLIKGSNKNEIKGILKKSIDRKDGDNFKKACKYYSEFFETERKLNKKLRNKFSDQELFGYFLYLFYDRMDNIDLQNSKNWKELKSQLDDPSEYRIGVIERIDDIEFMEDFFNCYLEYLKSEGICNDSLIDQLHDRLKDFCEEKDQLKKFEKIERDYSKYKQIDKIDDKNLKIAADFITTRYFQTKSPETEKERKYLSPTTIEEKIEQNVKNFANKIFDPPKVILPTGDKKAIGILTVLRRWNSFTPGLSSPASPSRGGGYFLYLRNEKGESKGIVIDPGFDFVNNLFFEGFSINDIDIVLITHAHPDHTDNFPKILTLLHEMDGRLKKWRRNPEESNRKQIKIVLSQGVFDLFNKQMDLSKESLQDIYVVDTKSMGYQPRICYNKGDLKIQAIKTSHSDLSEWESLGFIFSIGKNKALKKIGFTSDALWTKNFYKNFEDCSIVCAHLGAIVNVLKEKYFCETFCENHDENDENICNKCKLENFSQAKVGPKKLEKQIHDENHLYLAGLTSFFAPLLDNSNLKLGIISEFGEELKGGIRMDMYFKFNDWFKDPTKSTIDRRCLPGDIGLKVDIFSSDVLCQACQRYVNRKNIIPVPYGKEEGIFFICDECKSVLSTYQIEEKLKLYYQGL